MTITRAGEVVTTVALRTALRDDAHLPEEVARAQLGDSVAVAHHLGRSVLDHEELVGELALAHELGPLRDLDLVGVWRDGVALIARQRLKQRDGSKLTLLHGRDSHASAPSNASRCRLRSSPPPYPVSAPAAPITRWHGHDHGQRVAPVCGAHGAAGARPADPRGELRVGRGASVGDLGERVPDAALEGGPAWRERQLEPLQLAREVRLKLRLGLGERRRAAAARGRGAELDPAQAALVRAQQERPDRSVHRVHLVHATAAWRAAPPACPKTANSACEDDSRDRGLRALLPLHAEP